MLIQAGDLTINPDDVSHMEWDVRHYMNTGPDSTLVVVKLDGSRLRIKHEPNFLPAVDAYAVERAILNHHAARSG